MASTSPNAASDLEAEEVSGLSVSFFLNGLPSNPNKTKGHHWATHYAERQEWKTHAFYMAKASYKGRPFDKARVHFHISFGDNRTHDADNALASMKNVLDGLKGALIVDDSIDHIELSYSFDRAKPRGVQITVTQI